MESLPNFKLEALFGKQNLQLATLNDYIAWAEGLMMDGVENDSIYYLASLGLDKKPERWDVEETFNKCLRELQLNIPSKKYSIDKYLEFVAKQIINNEIIPLKGVQLLERAWVASEYSHPLLWIWGYLEEDLCFLEDYENPIFNSDLSKKNIDEFIISTAVQFLILLQLDVPSDFNYMYYCRDCSFIGDSKEVPSRKYLIPEWLYKKVFSRNYEKKHICSNCSSNSLLTMLDKKNREFYIEQNS